MTHNPSDQSHCTNCELKPGCSPQFKPDVLLMTKLEKANKTRAHREVGIKKKQLKSNTNLKKDRNTYTRVAVSKC